jgi:Uma2 family endonuclease
MALATAKRMTADEFYALPEQRHRELIDGEVVVNEPSVRHQRIAGRLFARLAVFAEEHPGIGEAGLAVDTPVDEHNVFGPDLWWTTPERTPEWDDSGLAGVPDLAIELRSPSTWRYDLGAKRGHYERAGLPELWLVDTVADTIIVLRRSAPEGAAFDVSLEVGAGDTLSTPIIPGFALHVGALFAR